jgi:hypothetical protein
MLWPVLSAYIRAVYQEALPRIGSSDLFWVSVTKVIAFFGAAVFPAINEWARIVPTWAGAIPIFFYLFAWAPYRAWVKQSGTIAELNDRLAESFTATPSTIPSEYGITVGLIVRTKTNTPVRGCTGHLRLHVGKFPLSGVLKWSPTDGGGIKADITAEAFLCVAEFPLSFDGDYRVCFAHQEYSWVHDESEGRRIAQVTLSADNSQSQVMSFELFIDYKSSEPVKSAQSGIVTRPLSAVGLRRLGQV